MILYCATTNSGKLREFRMAAGVIELRTPEGFEGIVPPDETGATFEENAIAKALYYGSRSGSLLFAEDSGLEVDVLGGAPGIHSARFAGPNATDESNNELLLAKLRGESNRAARYVCVIALVRENRVVRTFRGTVEGEIADAPRGSNGFGYDPLFYYPPFACTFGEADPAAKMRVSHRAQATAALCDYLRSL